MAADEGTRATEHLPTWWPSEKPYIIGDCTPILKGIPDKSVALVFADPPYNVGKDYGELVDDEKPGDEYVSWCKEWFTECQRISKKVFITPGNGNILLWGGIHKFRWVIAWIKSNSMRRGTLGFMCWEPILYEGIGQPKSYRDIYEIPTQPLPNCEHPCPKPVALIEAVIKDYTEPGDIIVDPFLGTGTTNLAARKTGRIGLGIEINGRWEKDIITRSLDDIPRLETFEVKE